MANCTHFTEILLHQVARQIYKITVQAIYRFCWAPENGFTSLAKETKKPLEMAGLTTPSPKPPEDDAPELWGHPPPSAQQSRFHEDLVLAGLGAFQRWELNRGDLADSVFQPDQAKQNIFKYDLVWFQTAIEHFLETCIQAPD